MTTTAARRVAPYGSWESPFPIDWLTVGRVSLGETRWDGDSITWLEGRPEEDGRATLVRWTRDDGARDISPPGMNVRDRVHEYGGRPYATRGDLVIVSDFATGRLHRVGPDRTSEPITPEGAFRYADLTFDPAGERLFAVREDHSQAPAEAENTLVAIALDGSSEVRVLASGRNFYAAPRPSPDGSRPFFDGRAGRSIDVPTYRRERMEAGVRVPGPAIIAEDETSTFITASFDARIDAAGCIVMERRAG